MLFGEGDAFVVDERGVFDAGDACADGVFYAGGGVGVGCDAHVEVAGFIDGGGEFFGRELLRLRIAAVGEDGAAGEEFDVVGAVVGELANFLADFPRAVGLAVAEIPGESDVGSEAGHGAGAAGDGDVGSGDEHARADDVAFGDGVAESDVVERAVDADVAHGGEAGVESHARVGDGLEGHFGGGVHELVARIDVAGVRAVGEVGVAVDEAGEDGGVGEVDGFCGGGDCAGWGRLRRWCRLRG